MDGVLGLHHVVTVFRAQASVLSLSLSHNAVILLRLSTGTYDKLLVLMEEPKTAAAWSRHES